MTPEDIGICHKDCSDSNRNSDEKKEDSTRTIGKHLKRYGIVKSNFETKPDRAKEIDKFYEAQEFAISNSGYQWRSLARIKRLPLKNDTDCDACVNFDSKAKSKNNLKDFMVYLEPTCNHKIHQSCRSRFSRAIWDFGGHSDGYQLTDCPICYMNQEFCRGTIYYSQEVCAQKKY